MAAPTKEDVLSELAALGVEVSEDEKMPDLQAKLKEARAQAASAAASDKPAETQAAPAATPSGKGDQVVMAENVTHDKVAYKKGATVSLDAATLKLFKAKGFVV